MDYIVIRPGVGLPAGFFPPDMDGRWFDLAMMPARPDPDSAYLARQITLGHGGAVAVPTGRFEQREDGAVAEVWEVRP